MIKDGLLAAHQKLSEYYYHFDLSPFYILWVIPPFHLCLNIDICPKCWTLTFHMKAWKQITHKMLTFLLPSRKQNQCCTPSIMTNTLVSHPALRETLQPLCRSCKVDHLKRLISLPDTNGPTAKSLMNSKITSSLGRSVLICADHLIGGGGEMPDSPICTVLLKTSLLFLVNCFQFVSTVHETNTLY